MKELYAGFWRQDSDNQYKKHRLTDAKIKRDTETKQERTTKQETAQTDY